MATSEKDTLQAEPDHFTVILEVQRVTPDRVVFKDSYDKTGTKFPRATQEVGRIVLRDEKLDHLLVRAAKALDSLNN